MSGLPNVPANFWNSGDKIYDNDVAGLRWGSYSQSQVRDYFANPSPPINPSGDYLYSNLGVGILGYALEQHAEASIDELMRERIFEPLGLESTSFALESTTTGHDSDGNPAAGWDKRTSILAGAFALRSTCRDMLTFAKANLSPAPSAIGRAMRAAQSPRGSINEVETTALGWKANKFGVVYATGTTGGFRCALFLHPSTKTTVVAMANTQVGGATGGRAANFDSFAGSLLNVTLGVAPLTIDFPSPKKTFDIPLDDYVGVFRPDDGSRGPSFPVRVDEGRLLTIGPGDMELRLWPSGDDSFFLRSYVGGFQFLRDDAGTVTGVDVAFEDQKGRLSRFSE